MRAVTRSDCWGMGVYSVERWRGVYEDMVQLVRLHDDLAWPATETPTLMSRPEGGLNMPAITTADHSRFAIALGKRVIQCVEWARVRDPHDRYISGPRVYHDLPGPDERIHPPWSDEKMERIVRRTAQHRAEMGLDDDDPIQIGNEVFGDASSPRLSDYEELCRLMRARFPSTFIIADWHPSISPGLPVDLLDFHMFPRSSEDDDDVESRIRSIVQDARERCRVEPGMLENALGRLPLYGPWTTRGLLRQRRIEETLDDLDVEHRNAWFGGYAGAGREWRGLGTPSTGYWEGSFDYYSEHEESPVGRYVRTRRQDPEPMPEPPTWDEMDPIQRLALIDVEKVASDLKPRRRRQIAVEVAKERPYTRGRMRQIAERDWGDAAVGVIRPDEDDA